MKTFGILGSTGSIGTQTLEVVNAFPGEFRIKYLTAHSNTEKLAEQALVYNPDTNKIELFLVYNPKTFNNANTAGDLYRY